MTRSPGKPALKEVQRFSTARIRHANPWGTPPATHRWRIAAVIVGALLVAFFGNAFIQSSRDLAERGVREARTSSEDRRSDQPSAQSGYPSLAPAAPTTPQDSKPALVPVKIKTGIIRRKGKGKPVAALKIEVDGGNYAMKVVDKNSNTEVLMVFIAANQTVETKVPLGSYRILAATGDDWYGDRLLFGPSTRYFVLHRVAGDDEFQFTFKNRTIYGQHIRLRAAVGGTLLIVPATPDEFQQR
jgi:hypothetical protein